MPHVVASSLARSLPLTHSPRGGAHHRGNQNQMLIASPAPQRGAITAHTAQFRLERRRRRTKPGLDARPALLSGSAPRAFPPSFPSLASHPRALRHLPAELGGPASAQLSCGKPRGLLGDVVRDGALAVMAPGGRGFSAEAWPKAHTRRRNAPRRIRATARQPPPLPVKSTPKS